MHACSQFFFEKQGNFTHLAYIYFEGFCSSSKSLFKMSRYYGKRKSSHTSIDSITTTSELLFLFFAVYVIYKKNYSFSRVVFFQSKTANSFYSKLNDSSRVRTTTFSSSRFGVRVSVMPNIFPIYPQHFLIPEINETLNGFCTKFFGTVRQKIFDEKCDTPYYA